MEANYTPERAELPYPFGSLRDILTTFFLHKFKIVTVFVVVFLGVTGWVLSSEILYESHASLVLKFGREHITRPEVGTVNQYARFDSSDAIQTEINIIKSRDLAKRVLLDSPNIYPNLMSRSGKIVTGA